MKTKHRFQLLALAVLLLSLLVCHPSASQAQDTTFTYQGRLNDGANAAGGTYDFRFRLASDSQGNNFVGSPLLTNGIAISSGLFTVALNFGGGIFTGSNYWLQVDVRTNGGGGYTTLTPLQSLTPTPYAVMANSASNLLGTLPAGQISGTILNMSLPANPNFSGTVTAASFTGNGVGLTNVNAATLGGLGSASFWRTNGNAGANPTNGAFLGTTDNLPLEFKVNGQRVLRIEYATNDISGYSPNSVGGFSANTVSNGFVGAVIGGGGRFGEPNYAGNSFTVVGGGMNNVASGILATVGGGHFNTASGVGATVGGGGFNTASADFATAMGYGNTASGGSATAMGDSSIASGFSSTAMGDGNIASGFSSTAMGYHNTASTNSTTAMGFSNTASDEFATAIGVNNSASGIAATAMGSLNTASGYAATAMGHFNTASNGYATAMGYLNTAGGFYATAVGFFNIASGQASAAMGSRARANHDGSFVWADYQGVQGPDFASTSSNQFCIRASGGVQLSGDTRMSFGSTLSQKIQLFGTDWGIGIQSGVQYYRVSASGVYAWYAGGVHNDNTLNAGGGATRMILTSAGLTVNGVVVSSSDRNMKENFAPVHPREVLEKVVALPLSSWNFKADTSTRHVGPMAQDFYAAFSIGLDDKHIATVDADGVALAAIQGLNEKLEKTVKRRDARIESLEKSVAELRVMVQNMVRQSNGDTR